MFTSDDIRFLDVEGVGRVTVPAVIRLDIDGKTDIGTDIMVSAGGIIVNIKFAVVSILDGVSHDLCCRIVVWNHPPCPVDDSPGKGKTVCHVLQGRFCITDTVAVTLVHWIGPPWY